MTTLLKQSAAALLSPWTGINEAELALRFEYPPDESLGDLSFPCFPLAKQLRRAPNAIAAELAAQVNAAGQPAPSPIRWRAEAAGGFLNLSAVGSEWIDAVLSEAESPQLGRLTDGTGKRVIIDYSSPNIAKPFGVGHLRSTVIGQALANLHRTAGWEVVTVNHLGDWGTQFGKLISAYRRWGDRIALENDPIGESLRLYVRFHDEAEDAPELIDDGREWFAKLEQGNEEARDLWTYFVRESLKEFQRIYARLGVSFDRLLGESFYNDQIKAAVERLQAAGLLEKSEGAVVVRLDAEGMPPCLMLKSDGSSIYGSRDLTTALYRREQMNGDKLLYVVGAEQSLHFRQVFAVLEKLDPTWADIELVHVPFGLMKMEGRKMSTRRGKVVFLHEVLEEAVQRASAVIEAKTPDLPDKEEIAEAVGTGAVIFGDLRNRRMLEADFKLEEMVSMEGETGPYLQYTHARARSLLRKAESLGILTNGSPTDLKSDDPANALETADAAAALHPRHASGAPNPHPLDTPAARACLFKLSQYSEAIRGALREHEPSFVARYLLDLAKTYNRFYNSGKILDLAPPQEQSAAGNAPGEAAPSASCAAASKLRLSAAVAETLRHGLALLGLKAPDKI